MVPSSTLLPTTASPSPHSAPPNVLIRACSPRLRRVIVSERNVLRREGTAVVIRRAGFDVISQASDPSELLTLVRADRPELVVVDIGLFSFGSPQATSVTIAMREELPDVGLLLLSDEFDEELVLALSWERAIGYLLKRSIVNPSVLVDALERVAEGGVVLDPSMVQRLVQAHGTHDPLAKLSSRERDVLALVAKGLSNVGIAREMYVSEGTVEKHVSRVLAKLDLREDADHHRRVLAAIAFRQSRSAAEAV
jgi:DNA-binding NarL/FixJ family response regulator